MLNFLDTKVNNLFSLLQVRAVTPKEATRVNPLDMPESFFWNSDGAYHRGEDLIAIRPTTSLDALMRYGTLDRNFVALHELIHWTKHESRLNRNNKEFLISQLNEHQTQYSTEEVTAQLGMLMLVEYLGLEGYDAAKRFRDLYNGQYLSADYFRAEKDARIAVRYIKDLIEDANSLQTAA